MATSGQEIRSTFLEAERRREEWDTWQRDRARAQSLERERSELARPEGRVWPEPGSSGEAGGIQPDNKFLGKQSIDNWQGLRLLLQLSEWLIMPTHSSNGQGPGWGQAMGGSLHAPWIKPCQEQAWWLRRLLPHQEERPTTAVCSGDRGKLKNSNFYSKTMSINH